ncbi:MAG: hypothetical protein ACM3ZF_16335 [Mycobacterium leprae]
MGLAETRPESLNLHRPPFDIVIEYVDEQGRHASETLYAAHDALYSRHSVCRGEVLLGHRRELARPAGLGGRVVGHLRARTGDRLVPFRIAADGSTVEESYGIEVNGRPGIFKLYVDGTILVRPSVGKAFRMKTAGWPLQPDEQLGITVDKISSEWDRPYWDT